MLALPGPAMMYPDNSGGWQSWRATLRRQVRVISALIRREARVHFGQARLGYLWAIIEPVLHLMVYAVLFTYIFRRTNPLGGDLILFMLTGLVPYFLFSKLASYLASAVEGNRALLNLPPVMPFDVLAARAVLESATYLFVGFILLVALALLNDVDVVPYHPMGLAAAIACTLAFGIGVGVINAVARSMFRNWMTLFGLALAPAFLLSGIWFLPSQIPMPFREYILYNPVAHYIMWVRTGFYSNYDPVELDRGYAVCCSALAVALGLLLLRVFRRRLLEPI